MYFFYRNKTKPFSLCCSSRKRCVTLLLSSGTTLFCIEDWSATPFLPAVGKLSSEIQRLICGNFYYSLAAFKYLYFSAVGDCMTYPARKYRVLIIVEPRTYLMIWLCEDRKKGWNNMAPKHGFFQTSTSPTNNNHKEDDHNNKISIQ
jgi:hypothetical protein